MKRVVLAVALFCLAAAPALALQPKTEQAIKVFKAVAADPAKLKLYCALADLVEDSDEKADPASEKKIEELLKQLGADFQAAWDTVEDVNPTSADGKALEDALDELESKCPN